MLTATALHLLTIITAEAANELIRVIMGEAGRFPELGRNFYDSGPGWILNAVAEYLTEANKAGLLAIADPVKASRQFVALTIDPLKLELTLGIRKPPSKTEIEQLAADAADAFLKIYG